MESKKMMSDKILLKQISEGQKQAFTELYQKYKDAVFGLCMRIMKSRSQAEEMSQETWVKVVNFSQTFQGEDSASSWILTIAKNNCLTEIKKSNKWHTTNDIETLESPIETKEFSNDFWKDLETSKAKLCVEKLLDRQRVAIVLFYFEEKSMKELASELDLQVNAVKALLFRARKNIINCVKGGGLNE